tara:strand:- start:13 stop:279 length:267 start_codon:yes stop_codon:yes gene_type:complete
VFIPNFIGADGSLLKRLLAKPAKKSLKISEFPFGSKDISSCSLARPILDPDAFTSESPSDFRVFQSSFGFPRFSSSLFFINCFFFFFY